MKIKTRPGEQSTPQIDPTEVKNFFNKRAEKVNTIGSLRAAIFQDKHPNLAERRDAAEKTLLLPKLGLQADSRILDIGCGTGRWAGVIAPLVESYQGTDFSEGLVNIARIEHGSTKNVCFSVLSSTSLSLESLGQSRGFDKIILMGLLIYLNDQDIIQTLRKVITVASTNCLLMIREPVGIDERLTIKEHFSEDLEQFYNAIYRTEKELLLMFAETIGRAGFKLTDSGYVYEQPDMNNHSDTIQKWYILERRKGD